MTIYGWKLNPKAQVAEKAKQLFGRDVKVTVTGKRPSLAECREKAMPLGVYVVEVAIGNKDVLSARHRNWRKAYGLLVIEVEKLFERSIHQPAGVQS